MGQAYHGWLVASCSHLFVPSYPEPKTAQRDTKKLQLRLFLLVSHYGKHWDA